MSFTDVYESNLLFYYLKWTKYWFVFIRLSVMIQSTSRAENYRPLPFPLFWSPQESFQLQVILTTNKHNMSAVPTRKFQIKSTCAAVTIWKSRWMGPKKVPTHQTIKQSDPKQAYSRIWITLQCWMNVSPISDSKVLIGRIPDVMFNYMMYRQHISMIW